MTPRQRLLAAVKGEKPDRVPFEPKYGFGNIESRRELESIEDPLRRQLAERIYPETSYLWDVDSKTNRHLMTPPQRMSSEEKKAPDGVIEWHETIDTPTGKLFSVIRPDPKAGTNWKIKYPVESIEDLAKLASVPWELPEGLKPPVKERPEGFDERGVLSIHIPSPMVAVGETMQYEKFLEICFTEQELISEMTQLCLDRIMDVLKVLFSKPGIEYVWLGGSEWLTPPMAPPELYDRYIQEQEKTIIDFVHQHNAIVHIHCHNNVRGALPKMIDRGGDYTEPVEPPPDGDITLAEAKELAAGRITLGGNIEARILQNENEEEVEKATRAAFEGGRERFILTPTGGMPPQLTDQQFRNYMRMIDVWEELSPL